MKSSVKAISLSVYGYGMMAMSTAIAALLLNGFFQKIGIDLAATWFVVLLAAASGALAVALVRTNLPNLTKPVQITFVTLLFIILLGSYLTSFFGYAEAYVLYFLHPFPENNFSFAKFMDGLMQVWLGVTVTAVICTAAYLMIQLFSPPKVSAPAPDAHSEETQGLAD